MDDSRLYLDSSLLRVELRDGHSSVSISVAEYKSLLQADQEYQRLKVSLIDGGISTETLHILINRPFPKVIFKPQINELRITISQIETPKLMKMANPVMQSGSNGHGEKKELSNLAFDSRSASISNIQPVSPTVTVTNDEQSEPPEVDSEVEYYEDRRENRSVVLKGLPQSATLEDITSILRGGQLLSVIPRPDRHLAYVSFVCPLAAEKFMVYSLKSDLQVGGKRIRVLWDDRQQYLSEHIARQIYYRAASRNLVIRFINPSIDADSIRDDLEHIHRLQVVNIRVEKGHAFISTNSISQALIARTCMTSRLKYRDNRIEFYPDECGQPLPPINQQLHTRVFQPKTTSELVSANRFALLEESEMGNDE